MKIKLLYEIDHVAARSAFVQNGIYYGSGNRMLGCDAELSELTDEERAVIWDNCKDTLNGSFIFDWCQIGKVCGNAHELVGEIRKMTTGNRV